jgi:hypothetical protein
MFSPTSTLKELMNLKKMQKMQS